MRIHSDIIIGHEFYDSALIIPGGDVAAEYTRHGSRSRDHAFEVSLTGHGERHTRTKAGNEGKAATWDDWGFFIAALFEIDPNAFWGSASYQTYEGARHFHILTCDRFNLLRVDFPTVALPKLKRAELAELRSDGFENAKWQA